MCDDRCAYALTSPLAAPTKTSRSDPVLKHAAVNIRSDGELCFFFSSSSWSSRNSKSRKSFSSLKLQLLYPRGKRFVRIQIDDVLLAVNVHAHEVFAETRAFAKLDVVVVSAAATILPRILVSNAQH